MADKADHELEVFKAFMKTAGLAVESGSVEARKPPEPDICCRVAGAVRYFELGRILGAELPKNRLAALRKYPEQVALDYAKVGLPERDVLRSKLGKAYQTDGHPVSLVLYYDWGPEAFLTALAPAVDIDQPFVDAVIMPELQKDMGAFDRIWIFERIRPSVLWVHPA